MPPAGVELLSSLMGQKLPWWPKVAAAVGGSVTFVEAFRDGVWMWERKLTIAF